MRTAVRTQEIRDVQALKISFVQHSVHEEAIMRRSDFTTGKIQISQQLNRTFEITKIS